MLPIFDARMDRQRKFYGHITNPLDSIHDDEAPKNYRFTKPIVANIVQMVEADIAYDTNRSRSIPAKVQVPVALQYLAGNSRQIEIALAFYITQRTVSTCIKRVCDSLFDQVGNHVYFPGVNELRRIKRSFYTRHGLPSML